MIKGVKVRGNRRNALLGQAHGVRLAAYWLEVFRNDIGADGAGCFFGKKKALAGQTRRACLVDGWFEDSISK